MNVRRPVNFLPCFMQSARKFSRSDPLPEHFIQQKYLG
jgi:hypothetical protein